MKSKCIMGLLMSAWISAAGAFAGSSICYGAAGTDIQLDVNLMEGRFRDYVSYNTNSDDNNAEVIPSTPGQLVLAKHLAEELKSIGMSEVTLDAQGYVMATLPANGADKAPVVGFISHTDTSPMAPGGPVKPQTVRNYDGKDILLNKEENIVLRTAEFPEILKYKGQDIVFSDGTTLLGADDKAGLAAIMSAMEYLVQHPEIRHGKIRVAFTPDEEIGSGTDAFDVEKFGADFAYTVDGGEIGGLEYENFNAASAYVTFNGRSVHPGAAKGKMINAITLAGDYQQRLPADERPENTEGRQGFYYIPDIKGSVEKCTMKITIRDFDRKQFESKKAYLRQLADSFDEKYGKGTVEVVLKDEYYNMKDKIDPDYMYVVDLARDAMTAAGVEPRTEAVRGGTDGATFSYKGLPCPDIFAGGFNFHSRYEYLPLHSLQKAGETVVWIAKKVAEL